MWILIKIIIVLSAPSIRLAIRLVRGGKEERTDSIRGTTCAVLSRSNKNEILETCFIIPFDCKAIFKLTVESRIDFFFKKLGIANEFQTLHREFDEKIYIASDSYTFKRELRTDEAAREKILLLFNHGCKSIRCDGRELLVDFPGDRREDLSLPDLSVSLFEQLSDINKNVKSFLKDPFAIEVLIIESLVWSLGIYAMTNFFEWQFFAEDTHLDIYLLARHGILAGLGMAALLFAFIVFLMKGSSRGYRVLVESFLVLLLSLPIGGIGIVADINKNLDRSEPVIIEGKVEDLYTRQHRRRKGGTYYTYHLHVGPQNETSDLQIPRHIKISKDTYSSLVKDGRVIIEIGRGRLKHPWYRSIRSAAN